jgi:Zn-dependent protease with chaperone function
MPIQVECAACQFFFRVADELAGRSGKCPKCRERVHVPTAETENGAGTYDLADPVAANRLARPRPSRTAVPSPEYAGLSAAHSLASEPTTPTKKPAEILTAFRGEIDPVRPTLLYRLWILVVAAAMVMLPIVYLAMIGLACYGLYFHATRSIVVFHGVRNARGAYLVYVAPLVAGIVLIAFMVKPLFARAGRSKKPRALDPSKYPLLYAFADGVCSSIGAPAPSRIEVNCEVNASAGIAGGPLALFQRDLVLTIGLPLLAGLNLRQFAGVLAHEFGHFSQGTGMRVSGLIRSINQWFARVVYERDEWDEMLEAYSKDQDVYILVLIHVTRLFVWLTRRFLWLLMMIGHGISSFMSRQMEFDADRYQARMVGGDVFESTMRHVGVLSLASQGAFADLGESWKEGRLADNLPKLILANVSQIPGPILTAFDEDTHIRKTGLFDSHPSDKDRISRAHAEDTDGIFHLDGPATDLVPEFDALAKSATLTFYRAVFGKGFSKECLEPVADAVRGQVVVSEGHHALERFFLGAFRADRVLPLPATAPASPKDPKAARRALESARDTLQSARDEYRSLLTRVDKLDGRLVELETASVLLKVDFRFRATEFSLSSLSPDAVSSAERVADAELQQLSAAAVLFDQAIVRRLHTALCLLEVDQVVARIPDGNHWRVESRLLYPVAVLIGTRVLPVMAPLLRARGALFGILGRWQGNEKNDRLHNAIRRGARRLHDLLQELSWKVGGGVLYPFDHAHGEISLARFVFPSVLPAADDINELIQMSHDVVDKIIPLHCRLLGRLILAAEEVERVFGLPELAVPAPEPA